jgi:glutaconate CoA-transferase subunit B
MSPSERAALIACRLAREISDEDVVGVGLGTPLALAAALMARRSHATGSHLLVAGALSPDADLATCLGGAAALAGRTAAFVPHVLTMEMAERRAMTLQFLRPAEVDGSGNANTSRIVAGDGCVRRLPGGLALADVVRILPRIVLYHTDHRLRSLPARVSFVTGAGGGDPLAGTLGPVRLVTDRAVFEFSSRGARLESLHPGEEIDRLRDDTGFAFAVDELRVTAEPTEAELAALHGVDPLALRELELRATRDAAAERLAGVPASAQAVDAGAPGR